MDDCYPDLLTLTVENNYAVIKTGVSKTTNNYVGVIARCVGA